MDFLMGLDFAAILKIIGIDIMLGADNAIVIALACVALPRVMRSRAMIMGTAGAILLRAGLLVAAGLLMGLVFVKLIAGAYLLFLGYKLLSEHNKETNVESPEGVMAAVKTIIVADFFMSIDNVFAVAGAAASAGPDATIYAIAGILFSIPIIVLGAKYLMSLMAKFPVIIWLGAGLLGWVGAEMMISDEAFHSLIGEQQGLAYKMAGFAAVIMAVLASKHFQKRRAKSGHYVRAFIPAGHPRSKVIVTKADSSDCASSSVT